MMGQLFRNLNIMIHVIIAHSRCGCLWWEDCKLLDWWEPPWTLVIWSKFEMVLYTHTLNTLYLICSFILNCTVFTVLNNRFCTVPFIYLKLYCAHYNQFFTVPSKRFRSFMYCTWARKSLFSIIFKKFYFYQGTLACSCICSCVRLNNNYPC